MAQSGSAGGSIGNDEKSLSGSRASANPQSPRGAASPRRTNRAARREKAAAAATISMAPGSSARRRHLSGHQQQRGRRHQRQDYRSDRQRHRQSRRRGVRHLHRQWHHGHHHRPPVRPQRRRNVPAIGRLHRKMDGGETIVCARVTAHRLKIGTSSSCEFTVQRAIRIASLRFPDLGALPTSATLAQSGSAGGSIGNDEKSLSGSREAPRAVEPSKPARRAKPESDEPRRASRRSGGESGGGGGNFDGSWVAVAVGTPCGRSTERFVISGGRISGELSSGSSQPKWLHDRTADPSQGLSWNSSGRFSGRTGSGSFVRSDGCTGRWTASKQ